MTQSTEQFYQGIPAYSKHFVEMLGDTSAQFSFPEDWHVVVTDIENSTYEYERNFYKNINTVAAESLRVVLRVAQERSITIPYIYGGDGMIAVIPESLLQETLAALGAYRAGRKEYLKDTKLRIGSLSVADIHKAGYVMQVSKFSLEKFYSEAVFIDAGMAYAERTIKDSPSYQYPEDSTAAGIQDVEGVTASWETLYQPTDDETILCLIIVPSDIQDYVPRYHEIMVQVEHIYGSYAERHPHIRTEREDVRLSTDALKLDGALKTILVGSDQQAKTLLEYLQRREDQKMLTFGHVLTGEPIVTSIVEERPGVHIGLIDVAGGGYIKASMELKEKLREI
jgi:hypothetical protein